MKIELSDDEREEVKVWMFEHLVHHAVSETTYDKLMHPEKYET